MTQLQRGGNASVPAGPIDVVARWQGPADLDADCTAYLLDESGKVRGDHDMVFFNQPRGGDGAVSLTAGEGEARFAVETGKVPADVARIAFCLTIDEAQVRGHSFATLADAAIRVEAAGTEAAGFAPDRAGAREAAMILGELYRRGTDWRFRAVGQGFDGGLAPLARSFGITVDDEPEATPPPPAVDVAKPTEPKKSILDKKWVTLTKPTERQTVSLAKVMDGKLIAKAKWIDNGDGIDNDDLDLRVGLLKPDGSFEMIHAPKKCGHFDKAPWIRHMGDVRKASKAMPGTETVEVNPAIAKHYGGRVGIVFSVYSAVQNGAVSVASLKPRMTMEFGDQVIECAFDFRRAFKLLKSMRYTYVIGTAVIDGDNIVLAPCGMSSKPMSEATPQLRWAEDGSLIVTIDGKHLFK